MSLRSLAGQPATERLLGILHRGRLAHAFIFIGEPGIGKRRAAFAFAGALLCTEPRDHDGCGGCPACQKVETLTHPDLHVVVPENRLIKVDKIRALEEAMALKTYAGGRRVVILKDADCMNEAAANAFLKTLEEPPPDSVLVVISSRPQLLPSTILSRAQPIRFRPLSHGEVRRAIEAAGLGDVERRVRLAEGRLDIALDDDLVQFHDRVERDLQGLLRGDLDVKEVWDGRDDAIGWVDALMGRLRDRIVMDVTGDGALATHPDGCPEIPTRSSGAGRLRELLDLARKMAQLRGQFRFNPNLAITLQWLGHRLREGGSP